MARGQNQKENNNNKKEDTNAKGKSAKKLLVHLKYGESKLKRKQGERKENVA